VSDTERWAVLARCAAPPTDRVVWLSGRWYVTDLDRPGELLRGPEFRTKRDAVRYAEANASAVWKRLNPPEG
jgi:hypothetical protein